MNLSGEKEIKFCEKLFFNTNSSNKSFVDRFKEKINFFNTDQGKTKYELLVNLLGEKSSYAYRFFEKLEDNDIL